MTKADIDLTKYKKVWVYVPKYQFPDGRIRKAIVEFKIEDGVPVAVDVYERVGEGFMGHSNPDIFWDEIDDNAPVWTDAMGPALNYLKTGRM